MKAVIMAGGKGTRLAGINSDLPKPMFPIVGKPVLEYQIESLKRSGITDIILVIGYFGNVVEDYFGEGKKWAVDITYIRENEPLGSAGALYYLKRKVDDDFVLLFGDVLLDVDFQRFMEFHKKHDGTITLLGHPNGHPFDSDLIEEGEGGLVKAILPKNGKRELFYHNLVNAGVYCISRDIPRSMSQVARRDLEKDVISEEIKKRNVYVYCSTEYVRDMGTPERLKSVETDVKKEIPSKRSLINHQKAIFLDRDGTINRLDGFISKSEDFVLLPGVTDAVRKINQSEYLVIIITNQPVLARGECTEEELNEIHKKMETVLGEKGAYIDALFYCPHHPDKGYEGERTELKMDCNCRKPRTGMVDAAAEQFNIDLRESWFIGDSTVDIQTGINAGMRTVLVHTGEEGNDGKFDVKADFEARDLAEAVDMILRWEE